MPKSSVNTEQPYQLCDVLDTQGHLDEAPVAPGTGVLTAVEVGAPQGDHHLRASRVVKCGGLDERRPRRDMHSPPGSLWGRRPA